MYDHLSKTDLVCALDAFIDHKLNKAGGVNKPFKAIQKTEDFKTYRTLFENGLKDQASWVADHLDELLSGAGVATDTLELTADQTDKLHGQLRRDMPKIGDLVTEYKVFSLLKSFFEWSAVQQYRRWGYTAKATVSFNLTNQKYIQALQDRAAYLLNQSSLDDTTLDQIISLIGDGKLDGLTNSEVASQLTDQFDDISQSRADMIARTEAANAMGAANHATASENGAQTKSWIAAGGAHDDECADNADAGEIPIDQPFPSGDMYEPAHPNCECYTEAGLIDLDSIDLWDGA